MIGGRMVTGMGPARSTLGLAPLVVATVLLALVVAGSTAVAGWVPVAEPLGGLALAAAIAGCLLALAPVSGRLAVALIVLPAPFAALAAATPARQSSGGRPPATWWSEL